MGILEYIEEKAAATFGNKPQIAILTYDVIPIMNSDIDKKFDDAMHTNSKWQSLRDYLHI